LKGTCPNVLDYFGCLFRCSRRQGHRTPNHIAVVRSSPLGRVVVQWTAPPLAWTGGTHWP